ncbi:hypothetical protein D7Z26_24050 [Cohnella endophytica]|uniref:DUF6385 domain-containing protein n=1 Tax=Cohnella endophytica TaxID=2419778 RepID=A0A494XA20_9BACL|nr:DUF6385 domain-containing protein [Cohnella endophytica]RKP47368.1 hypothetical protein D7Z26_24050 [Cohnella endophytica]
MNGEAQHLPPVDVSRKSVYSFGIVNRGDKAVVAHIEISPDNAHYASDTEETVQGGETLALVPMRFLRFARISVRTVEPGQTSLVDVYFQAQAVG